MRSIYDPSAGTGGFLSSGMEYVHELNSKARLAPFGQELNPESYAICKADMLIKGLDVSKIRLGNTLSDDQLAGEHFAYMPSNPPFGVDWKKIQKPITDEQKLKRHAGRFGPGLLLQLRDFLIELGRDFCFIGTEFPLQVGGRDFALDREVKKPHENPAIGVLLCASKDAEVVEYAATHSNPPPTPKRSM